MMGEWGNLCFPRRSIGRRLETFPADANTNGVVRHSGKLWNDSRKSSKSKSGPPPNLVMRVAEVRFFVPNERSAIPPEQAMVMDLGTDLLPDVADASDSAQVYREMYGTDVCAHGFLAMRLKCADETKAAAESSTIEEPRAKEVASKSADATVRSQTGVRRRRTCASLASLAKSYHRRAERPGGRQEASKDKVG